MKTSHQRATDYLVKEGVLSRKSVQPVAITASARVGPVLVSAPFVKHTATLSFSVVSNTIFLQSSFTKPVTRISSSCNSGYISPMIFDKILQTSCCDLGRRELTMSLPLLRGRASRSHADAPRLAHSLNLRPVAGTGKTVHYLIRRELTMSLPLLRGRASRSHAESHKFHHTSEVFLVLLRYRTRYRWW